MPRHNDDLASSKSSITLWATNDEFATWVDVQVGVVTIPIRKKEKKTLHLLEVSDGTQEKFKEQTTKAPLPFLLDAIDLASRCELDYKNTKNKRLLIELCLMQIASLHFGEK